MKQKPSRNVEHQNRRQAFEDGAKAIEREQDASGKSFFKQLVLMWLGGMLELPTGKPVELPDHVSRYIAARLIPIIEAEIAARAGRPGERRAGEAVQARIDGGMAQLAARKAFAKSAGLKLASVTKAHRRYLEKRDPDKPALLYTAPVMAR